MPREGLDVRRDVSADLSLSSVGDVVGVVEGFSVGDITESLLFAITGRTQMA